MLWWYGLINGIKGLLWSRPHLHLYNHLQCLSSHKLCFRYIDLEFLLDVRLFLSSTPVLMWSPLSAMHVISFFIQLSTIHPQMSLHGDSQPPFPGLTWLADGMNEKGKKWRRQGFGLTHSKKRAVILWYRKDWGFGSWTHGLILDLWSLNDDKISRWSYLLGI